LAEEKTTHVILTDDEWRSAVSELGQLPLPTARHVLVVAPHPDDETLGMGGTIYDWIKSGVDVHILIATDGSKSHEHANIKRVRRAEALAAATHLGVADRLTFVDLPDSELEAHIDALTNAIDTAIPQDGHAALVIAPRFNDGHKDHDAAAVAAASFALRRGPQVKVWSYGVWTWINDFSPDVLDGCLRWELSPEAHTAKRLAVNEYVSQISNRFGTQIVTNDLLKASAKDSEVFWCPGPT
jgi:LmbE family N-acetylglucosaminyl deacetylase